MRKFMMLAVCVVALAINASLVAATKTLDDGGMHIIGDPVTYAGDSLYVDWGFPGNATQVYLVPGGVIGEDFGGKEDAKLYIDGGTVGRYLFAWERTKVEMTAGTIAASITLNNKAEMTMTGGTSGPATGGNISVKNDSQLYLHGTFTYNGAPVAPGTKLTDIFTGYSTSLDYYYGTLTGTMANGDPLTNQFVIYSHGAGGTADVTVIPEPMTVALLGIGGLLMRRRKA